jgi:hypothetical protein
MNAPHQLRLLSPSWINCSPPWFKSPGYIALDNELSGADNEREGGELQKFGNILRIKNCTHMLTIVSVSTIKEYPLEKPKNRAGAVVAPSSGSRT